MGKILKIALALAVVGVLIQAGTGGIYLGLDLGTVKAKGVNGKLRDQVRVTCKYFKLPNGFTEERRWPAGTNPKTFLQDGDELNMIAEDAILGPEGCPKRWLWER